MINVAGVMVAGLEMQLTPDNKHDIVDYRVRMMLKQIGLTGDSDIEQLYEDMCVPVRVEVSMELEELAKQAARTAEIEAKRLADEENRQRDYLATIAKAELDKFRAQELLDTQLDAEAQNAKTRQDAARRTKERIAARDAEKPRCKRIQCQRLCHTPDPFCGPSCKTMQERIDASIVSQNKILLEALETQKGTIAKGNMSEDLRARLEVALKIKCDKKKHDVMAIAFKYEMDTALQDNPVPEMQRCTEWAYTGYCPYRETCRKTHIPWNVYDVTRISGHAHMVSPEQQEAREE